MKEDKNSTDSARLQKLVNDLQGRISHYEISEQKTREIQDRLDMQLDRFNRIHAYGQNAFHTNTMEDLYAVIADGVVDIFQLEVGAIFHLSPSGDSLLLDGACNLDGAPEAIEVGKEWIARRELWDFRAQTAVREAPLPADSPLEALGLSHAIYTPLYNNARKLEGIILGGITKERSSFYDFLGRESISSFMVYCQQMNGIYNNFLAIHEAKKADKAKTLFLSNLSHEMRTPMNAIIGMVQLSKRSNSLEALKKGMTQVETSSKHLLSLINDVLDISKIEGGKMVLASQPFHLTALIDSLLGSVKQSAADKGQRLEVLYGPDVSPALVGDSMRLSQVLINLISNAVKFTPAGGRVAMTVEQVARGEDSVLLQFAVDDTGIGVAPGFYETIFLPFEQADGTISRDYGGTGLGLAISQRIVQLMGGKIQVDSRVGEGSRFHFSVWLALDTEKDAQQTQDLPADGAVPDYSGKRVLIVDDIAINREIISAFLEDTDIAVENGENGEQAVSMVEQSPHGYYDLILMDIQMPVMDGYTATRLIRGLERPDARTIAILAMTANVFKDDVQQAIDSGMNGHVGKPVEYDALMAAIRQALR